jgi:hypothetical protein
MARRAQAKLDGEYSIGRLRKQVLDMISRVHATAREQLDQDEKADALVK